MLTNTIIRHSGVLNEDFVQIIKEKIRKKLLLNQSFIYLTEY